MPTSYAIPNAPNWWPSKLPSAVLDYSLDIASAIDPDEDVIAQMTAAIAPSGAGEMTASNLRAEGSLITVTMTGGVGSRIYTTRLIVTMTDNRIFEFLVYQGVPQELPGYAVPVPPSPSFGATTNWYLADIDETTAATDTVAAAP